LFQKKSHPACVYLGLKNKNHTSFLPNKINSKMEGGIFLSIKDLMRLTGSNNYNSTGNVHRALRDSIGKNKKKITIKEYCDYENVDFDFVWNFLRKNDKK
jgi:hypothetical protein